MVTNAADTSFSSKRFAETFYLTTNFAFILSTIVSFKTWHEEQGTDHLCGGVGRGEVGWNGRRFGGLWY